MSDGATPSVLSAATLRPSGALLAAHQALGRLIDNEAVPRTGQDPTTMDLLVRLDQAPGNRLRAVDLSRQLQLSPSHISRRIDRAEAAGLVARSADPDDRRASRVTLTPAGREVVRRFAPALEAIIDEVIRRTLRPEEIERLVELLNRVEAAARRRHPDTDPG